MGGHWDQVLVKPPWLPMFTRCSRYLYTLIMADKGKAEKLKQSLPPSLQKKEIWASDGREPTALDDNGGWCKKWLHRRGTLDWPSSNAEIMQRNLAIFLFWKKTSIRSKLTSIFQGFCVFDWFWVDGNVDAIYTCICDVLTKASVAGCWKVTCSWEWFEIVALKVTYISLYMRTE